MTQEEKAEWKGGVKCTACRQTDHTRKTGRHVFPRTIMHKCLHDNKMKEASKCGANRTQSDSFLSAFLAVLLPSVWVSGSMISWEKKKRSVSENNWSIYTCALACNSGRLWSQLQHGFPLARKPRMHCVSFSSYKKMSHVQTGPQ